MIRIPGFSAEASLYSLSDSRYMAMESAAQAESKSIVPQLLPKSGPHLAGCRNLGGRYRLCLACDDGECEPVVVSNTTGGAN